MADTYTGYDEDDEPEDWYGECQGCGKETNLHYGYCVSCEDANREYDERDERYGDIRLHDPRYKPE